MGKYLIENKVTKEKVVVKAPSAQVACEMNGWLIGDCWVKKLRKESLVFPGLLKEVKNGNKKTR